MGLRWEKDESWQGKNSERWVGHLPDDPAARTYPAMPVAAIVTRTWEGKYDATLIERDSVGLVHAEDDLGEYSTFEKATKICEVTLALDGYTLHP